MAQFTLCKAAMVPMALIGLMISAGPASAADSAPATKIPSTRGKAQARTLAQLRAQVATLERQVKLLEGRLDTMAAVTAAAAPAPAPAAAPSNMLALAPVAAVPVQDTTPPPAAVRPVAPKSGPGTFDVDEEAAQRALERTLTQSGALLLPPRMITLTPNLSYTRRETAETPIPANITAGGITFPTLVNVRNRRNEVSARLDLKAGLPLDSQLELSLPYTHVSQSVQSDFSTESTTSGNGLGDLTVGVAKTLLREKGWRPDLIGRLVYGTGSGKLQDGPVFLGGGFRSVQAELVALKRQDPLAFVGSVFYNRAFEKDLIRPGDAAGFSVAALLAASPATSLQMGFSQTFRKETELNGVKSSGSKSAFGMFSIGASSILARDIMLNTQLGIGLGNDAPKYTFMISLPITF
jgi:hypothetical protein